MLETPPRLSLFDKVRSLTRMLGLIVVCAWYVGTMLVMAPFKRDKKALGAERRRSFTKATLKVLGVRPTVKGKDPGGACLFVSNHRSLLDPFVELAHIQAHVVSKAEVGKYPILGYGVKLTGVVLVERESNSSRVMAREAIRKALTDGNSVLIYPEGTTSNIEATQEFRRGSFHVAFEENIPVVPIALNYGSPYDNWNDGPLYPFFQRKFAKKHTDVQMEIGEPITGAETADALMHEARSWINDRIFAMKNTKKVAEKSLA